MNGEIMNFVKSDSMKISVSKEQEKQLSSKETILQGIKENKVIAFDIFDDSELIGFAMIREFERGCFFLWDFAIDSKFQNKGLGEKSLTELLLFMKKNYSIEIMTTTYIKGNNHAKHIYEKVGFKETDVVDEPDCKEVNMVYLFN